MNFLLYTSFIIAPLVFHASVSNHTSSNETHELNNSKVIKTWKGTEHLLFCHLDLDPALKFKKDFHITKIPEGWIVEIEAQALNNQICFHQGKLIKSYELKLTCLNDTNDKKVSYRLDHLIICSGINEDGLKEDIKFNFEQSGSLQNPRIDLSKEPTFELFKDHSGRFVFENAYPFSKI